MSANPTDIANVIKLLERLRTGEMNLIPSVGVSEPKQDASTELLQRVETLLSDHLRRMQESVGDGGSAFPEVPGDSNAYEGRSGMSMRDYFAAAALQGELAAQDELTTGVYTPSTFDSLAANSYAIADAMLKARSA